MSLTRTALRMRRLRLAFGYRVSPWRIPADVVRLIGTRKSPREVFEEFRAIHQDRGRLDRIGQRGVAATRQESLDSADPENVYADDYYGSDAARTGMRPSPNEHYEITIGFGECSVEGAEALMERVAEALFDGSLGETYGVVRLGHWDDWDGQP